MVLQKRAHSTERDVATLSAYKSIQRAHVTQLPPPCRRQDGSCCRECCQTVSTVLFPVTLDAASWHTRPGGSAISAEWFHEQSPSRLSSGSLGGKLNRHLVKMSGSSSSQSHSRVFTSWKWEHFKLPGRQASRHTGCLLPLPNDKHRPPVFSATRSNITRKRSNSTGATVWVSRVRFSPYPLKRQPRC